jgi:hypothetical protein
MTDDIISENKPIFADIMNMAFGLFEDITKSSTIAGTFSKYPTFS